MTLLKPLLLLFACALAAAQPAPPARKTPVAPLLAGEGLALTGPDGKIYLFGDAERETPMGGLADLVWLKLEGSQWAGMNAEFDCKGSYGGYTCRRPKGHGKVDLARALRENCDLAFLYWGRASVQWWLHDYGEGPARARMEDAFSPFLGDRMPPGEGIPALDPGWFGGGDRLRTSPASMVVWFLDPGQDPVVRMTRRLLLSFTETTVKEGIWWIYGCTAMDPAAPGAELAWAAGGNGQLLAVLRLPAGKSAADAQARFRAVMMVPAGK